MTDTLRPTGLDDYVGQAQMKARLQVMVDAAMATSRPLPHLLFTGPPGTGKTALAYVLSEMTGEPIHKLTMPVDIKELEYLFRFKTGIFFLEEIQGASKLVQARLLTAMEFGELPVSSGPPIVNEFFTIVAATTNPEAITAALMDRFIVPPFEPYSVEDMAAIVASMAGKADVRLDDETILALAHATSGTPRYAKKMIEAARQLADALWGIPPDVEAILHQAGFAHDGLTEAHLLYLEALGDFDGIGLAPLSRHLRMHPTVCLDLERLLMDHHLITWGSGMGRRLTTDGRHRITARKEAA